MAILCYFKPRLSPPLLKSLHCGGNLTKKVMYDSPGLVDFAIGLVILVLNLPDRRVLFFGKIQIT